MISGLSHFLHQLGASSDLKYRFLRALAGGTLAASVYLVFLQKSYATEIGDILLWFGLGPSYYDLSHQQWSVLLKLANSVVWFLFAALPFLIIRRVRVSLVVLVSFPLCLIACGFLVILVGVSGTAAGF